MRRKLQGSYTKVSMIGESVLAFVPVPLPPYPSIEWSLELLGKFDQCFDARFLICIDRVKLTRQYRVDATALFSVLMCSVIPGAAIFRTILINGLN